MFLFIWECLNTSLTFGGHFFLKEVSLTIFCLFVFVFFWTFESMCPLPSGLQTFWWERNLMVILLRVTSVWSHLSWCSQDCLFLWLLKVWECFSVSLLVHLTWSWLNFLDIYIYVFYQTWEIFSHFFQIFYHPFPSFSLDTPTTHMSVLLTVSHRSFQALWLLL